MGSILDIVADDICHQPNSRLLRDSLKQVVFMLLCFCLMIHVVLCLKGAGVKTDEVE